MSSIPSIDLTPLSEPYDHQNYQDLAAQIKDIYTHIGFAYLINHPVAPHIIDDAFQASAEFHALPEDEKRLIKQNACMRGYIPLASSTLKVSSLGKAVVPNQSSAFMMMHEVDPTHPDYQASVNLAGPNQWPSEVSVPQFRIRVTDYYEAMSLLAHKIVRLFALAFDLPITGLDPLFISPTTFLRLQHYPKQPENIPKHQYGSAPHTDYGFITLLSQRDIGGLEVQPPSGGWIDVPCVNNSLILNSGDMVHHMSNGRFIATPHRVINQSGQERYSIPFFFDPSMHAILKPLPSFVDQQHPARYPAISYHEYLMQRIRANYQG